MSECRYFWIYDYDQASNPTTSQHSEIIKYNINYSVVMFVVGKKTQKIIRASTFQMNTESLTQLFFDGAFYTGTNYLLILLDNLYIDSLYKKKIIIDEYEDEESLKEKYEIEEWRVNRQKKEKRQEIEWIENYITRKYIT